jgi:hypothetical protein
MGDAASVRDEDEGQRKFGGENGSEKDINTSTRTIRLNERRENEMNGLGSQNEKPTVRNAYKTLTSSV